MSFTIETYYPNSEFHNGPGYLVLAGIFEDGTTKILKEPLPSSNRRAAELELIREWERLVKTHDNR